jgi:outer membrane immunogenic protein
MKTRYGWALASAMLLGSIGSASAADMPLKAPPIVAPVWSWTGFYVGGFLGGAGLNNNINSSDGQNPSDVTVGAATFLAGTPAICDGTTPGLKPGCTASYGMGASVIAGGTAGYNWQVGRTVLGVEAEGGYLHMTGSAPLPFLAGAPCGVGAGYPCVVNFNARIGDWYATLAGRLGVTANALNASWSNQVLLYVKGGAAVTQVSSSEVSTGTTGFAVNVAPFTFSGNNSTIWGWVAGAGIEWAINRNWSVKAEYEFLGFDRSVTGCGILPLGAAGAGGTWCESTHIDGIHTGKIGLNYHFGGPVVAKY